MVTEFLVETGSRATSYLAYVAAVVTCPLFKPSDEQTAYSSVLVLR